MITRHSSAALCSLVLSGALLAVGVPAHAAHHVPSKTATLSLAITRTGSTVWGTVQVRYTRAHRAVTSACTTAHCRLNIPMGVGVHLTQTQTDATTWPFSKWQIRSGSKTRFLTTPGASLRMTGPVTVTAVYILKQTSSSYPPPANNPYP